MQNLYSKGDLIDIETTPLILPFGSSCKAILPNAQIDTQQFFQDYESLVIYSPIILAMYLPTISNSKLTTSPGLNVLKLVCSYV